MGISIIFVFLGYITYVVGQAPAPQPYVVGQAPAPQPNAPDKITTFNVINFGAIGDGKTDDSKAFLAAWKSACNQVGNSTLNIPQGKTFLLHPITFVGPCKSSQIEFSLQGTIVAPNSFSGWNNCKGTSWIYFGNVQSLNFIGQGKIDGRGALWWHKTIPSGVGCNVRPTALRFHTCNGLKIEGTTHMNSPWNHIQVGGSINVEMSQLNIIAPAHSPNTDGIDIATSSNVFIHDTFIGSGDDCIAIKGGSFFINITRVHCGPGHGISVGSLGAKGAHEVVEHVFVNNCTLNGTTNGARIKTWEGGSGHVSNVVFQDIILNNSQHPIIIDQSYFSRPTNKTASNLKLSDIIFRGFEGTSATKEAITLQCSGREPCTKLTFDNINISSAKIGGALISDCANAHGIIVPPVVPNVTCLLR